MNNLKPETYKLIGKIFSKKLDGNLSVALIDPDNTEDEIAGLSCVLFTSDSKTFIDSFIIGLKRESFLQSLEEGTLFSRLEDLYLIIAQETKDSGSNTCLQ